MEICVSFTETIDKIRPSIVQINCIASGLSEEVRQQIGQIFIFKVLGTGFFVNAEAHIITARHVIQAGNNWLRRMNAANKKMNVSIGLPNSENFIGNRVGIDFDIVDEDENYDLAVLKLRRNPFREEISAGIRIRGKDVPIQVSTAKLRSQRPMEGQWIGISGYPFEERVMVTNSGYVASVWTIPNYLADAEVNPGNSGGPVYLVEDASVIGVCVAIRGSKVWNERGEPVPNLFYSSGITQIIPTLRITELLDKQGIPYTLT